MRKFLLILVIVAFSSMAFAGTVNLTLVSVNGQIAENGTDYVNPYTGSLNGGKTVFPIFCDDLLNGMGIGQTAQYYALNGGGNLSQGRWSTQQYGKEFYLVSQFAVHPGSEVALTEAMWNVTTPGSFGDNGKTAMFNPLFWGIMAGNYTPNAAFMKSFTVFAPANGTQEFITYTSQVPTPEPSTLLMMGSSLIGLAGLARKRLFR